MTGFELLLMNCENHKKEINGRIRELPKHCNTSYNKKPEQINHCTGKDSVTRLGDLLDCGQLFEAFTRGHH